MDPADDTQAESVWLTRLKLIALTAAFSLLFGSIFLGGLWFATTVALGTFPGVLHVSRNEGVIIGLFIAGLGGLFLWRVIATVRADFSADAAKLHLVIR